jgi:hypothetical protein
MFNRKFTLLFVFYVSYLWFVSIGTSILPTHFLSQKLSFSEMILGFALRFAVPIILLFFIKNLSAKKSWFIALISTISYILLSISIQTKLQFYLASAIGGTTLFFFYLCYNIAYFENISKERRGRGGALMFIVPSTIGILAPSLAGFLGQKNMLYVWIISIISFFISLSFLYFQNDFKISLNIKEAIREIKETKILIFLEGIWSVLSNGVIPIFTLYFIKSPLKYGFYLSYLALISIVVSFVIGKVSDKINKRTMFVIPLALALAVATFMFTILKLNLTNWIILTGIVKFIEPLFFSTSISLLVDNHDVRPLMSGRELMLSSGRVTGLLLVFVSFSLERSPFYIFIILGSAMLTYSILLFWKTKISKVCNFA